MAVLNSQSRPRPFKRVLQLELNEISRPLIESMVAEGELPTFARLCRDWQVYRTTSESEYTHIEPWIQWVTAHTGKSLGEHGVFRLGDGFKLHHRQIWEVLSDHGHESVILGSMNTHRGATKGGVFFPDPWSKTEDVYPESLRGLFNLVSRKVQAHATSSLTASDVFDGIKSMAGMKVKARTAGGVAAQLVRQKLKPNQAWRMAGYFDQVLADILGNFVDDSRYSFCTLFLNSIAHYQHHFWRNHAPKGFSPAVQSPDCAPKDDPVRWGYRNFDRLLARVLRHVNLDETLVVIASGLTQIPFKEKDGEGGCNYYRLRNHQEFAQRVLGLSPEQVFPMMSRDWQIGPFDESTFTGMMAAIDSIKVGSEKVFSASRAVDTYIFMETAITRHVDLGEAITCQGRDVGSFRQYFERVAVKSGHHSGVGYLWTSADLPELKGLHTIPLTYLPDITLSALGLDARMSTGPRPAATPSDADVQIPRAAATKEDRTPASRTPTPRPAQELPAGL